jgi:apolipoprotein N-acyltransferase
MQSVLPWLLALVSGGLLGLCFPPWDFGNLVWLALCPLAWALWMCGPTGRRSPWWNAGLGYAFGLVFFSMGAFWLTTLTWPGYLLLVLYFSFYTAGWAAFAGTLRPEGDGSAWLGSLHNLRACALGAAGWAAMEWLRGVVFPAFGWNGLGIAQHANIPFIQIADIAGVGGISFTVAMAALMLVATVKRLALEIGRGARKPHYDFALTVALVALVWGYGVRAMFGPVPGQTGMSFAAVQGNVPQHERNNPALEADVLAVYERQTQAAIAMQPDLILWPESSTPSPLLGNQMTWDLVRGLAEQHAGDFLLGTVHWGEEGDYNSIALLTSRGSSVQLHHKIHLVPFGEYVPLREEFPPLAAVVGELVPDDFDPGREFTIMEMEAKPVKIAPLVCFEDTLGDLVRRFALGGAQLLVTVTNDGWFLESAGSLQHLRNSLFRCVETKLPMVRAANTGVTCAIDRFGVVREVLRDEKGSTFIQGVLFGKVEVPVEPQTTFYSRHGEVFSLGCLAASILWGAFAVARFWKNKKSPCPAAGEAEPSEE